MFDNYQQNNLLSNSLIVNNSSNKSDTSINNSKSYNSVCDDKVILSNLVESLKTNEHVVQDSFKDNWKNVSLNKEVANKMYGSTKFIEECAKKNMIGKLQDGNSIYNKNKNSNYITENLKKNVEFVKRQTEMRQNNKFERKKLNVSGSLNNVSFYETFFIYY